jgi:hypothetical protein
MAAVVCSAWVQACITLRVPARAPEFAAADLVRATVEDVTLEARAIQGTAANHDLFDDDLPEIGIGAVWVSIRNARSAPIDLGSVQWALTMRDRQYAALRRDDLLKRFYKGRKIRLYSTRTHGDAQAALDRALFRATTIAPGSTAAGFVFLKTEPTRTPSWARGATLVARGVGVGDGRRIDVQVTLAEGVPEHARP